MILTLRTDNPDAEIGLYAGQHQLRYRKWHADRALAKELLATIRDELTAEKSSWTDITGIVVFEGPGSFTGLRIGITVADTLAYGLQVPIVAAKDDDWLTTGIGRLLAGQDDKLALPHYGREANITLPKK